MSIPILCENITYVSCTFTMRTSNLRISNAACMCCAIILVLADTHTHKALLRVDFCDVPTNSSMNPNIMWKHNLCIIYFYNENIQYAYKQCCVYALRNNIVLAETHTHTHKALLRVGLCDIPTSSSVNPNIMWKYTLTIIYFYNKNIQYAYKQCCIYKLSQNLILLAQHTQ